MNTFILNIKKDFEVNKKSILIMLCALFGTCILLGGIMGYNGAGGGWGEVWLFATILALAGYAANSVAFADMKRKETRINLLMAPCSTFEKFMTRWLAFGPVLFLVLILAFYVGEFSRLLTALCFDSHQGEAYYHVVNPFSAGLFEDEENMGKAIWMVLLVYFFIQSIFFLGAILWPKLSFLKTVLVIWIGQTVLSLIFVLIVRVFNLEMWLYLNLDNFEALQTIYCVVVFEVIFIIFCYVMAYLKFKRSQVISKLF